MSDVVQGFVAKSARQVGHGGRVREKRWRVGVVKGGNWQIVLAVR